MNSFKCKKDNMSCIPFIVHEEQMFKAYEREKRLKTIIVLTNSLWLIGAILAFVVR